MPDDWIERLLDHVSQVANENDYTTLAALDVMERRYRERIADKESE